MLWCKVTYANRLYTNYCKLQIASVARRYTQFHLCCQKLFFTLRDDGRLVLIPHFPLWLFHIFHTPVVPKDMSDLCVPPPRTPLTLEYIHWQAISRFLEERRHSEFHYPLEFSSHANLRRLCNWKPQRSHSGTSCEVRWMAVDARGSARTFFQFCRHTLVVWRACTQAHTHACIH